MISTSGSSNLTIAGVSTTETTGTGVTWLSAQIANANVVPGIPGSITITGNSSGLPAGTYTGSVTVTPSTGGALTVPVNFTVGSGGGSGNWNVNPSSISWNYSTGGGFPRQVVSVTPTFGATYYNVSTTSSNGWLLASINGSDGNAFSQVALGTRFDLKTVGAGKRLSAGRVSRNGEPERFHRQSVHYQHHPHREWRQLHWPEHHPEPPYVQRGTKQR